MCPSVSSIPGTVQASPVGANVEDGWVSSVQLDAPNAGGFEPFIFELPGLAAIGAFLYSLAGGEVNSLRMKIIESH